MYDWEKTLNTSDPEYYKWTQWLFLQMYENGLAYKKLGNVNFCPKDQTVLANEQVWEGKCERCGTEVVQKPLEQWYWQITKYAQKLIDNLDKLDWPEKTKLMQKNWIGRSEGAEITFDIEGQQEKITVFTTRPDTLFGVTYMVLSPEHPLVETITPENRMGSVKVYREQTRKKTELQRTDLNKIKTGEATGAFAINPATNEKIPIWIADYVLMNYGTGAVMAVPGHDERDFEFAKNYKLPVKEVVIPGSSARSAERNEGAFTDDGTAVNSEFLNGLGTAEAKKRIVAWLEDEERGRGVVTYRLRDWLVSRQRYWGAPIPVVYDPSGKPHPVPEKHLPWLLPTDVEFKPTGKSPLTESKEFKERTEKIFGKGWTPEYDTMDTFVCSSFYYLRYLTMANDELRTAETRHPPSDIRHLVDPHLERTWMPVDMYIGGPEHACMHLIYARFVMMALKDFGFVSHEEPFQKLVHQGLITNQGAKMSKSKGNVVSPDTFVEKHGSDAFRMYLMFMGPFTDGGDWSDTGIKGIDRFVQRVWKAFGKGTEGTQETKDVTMALHQTIKKVTDSMDKMHFNTAISALMEFLNAIDGKEASADTAKIFTRLLAPLAPHLAEELWENQKGEGLVVNQKWPAFDPKLLQSDTMMIVVQVNGKVRGQIEIGSGASEKEIIAAGKNDPNVQKYLEGKTPKKEIYVKGKLVSLVM
jgi:leucyl-tRNA synthetase